MTAAEYRAAAISKLHAAGIKISSKSRSPSIVSAIEKLTGRAYGYRRDHFEIVRLFVDPPAAVVDRLVPFKPMRYEPHPRIDEINAAQPPLMTPRGLGNGIEGRHGYGRGGQ